MVLLLFLGFLLGPCQPKPKFLNLPFVLLSKLLKGSFLSLPVVLSKVLEAVLEVPLANLFKLLEASLELLETSLEASLEALGPHIAHINDCILCREVTYRLFEDLSRVILCP